MTGNPLVVDSSSSAAGQAGVQGLGFSNNQAPSSSTLLATVPEVAPQAQSTEAATLVANPAPSPAVSPPVISAPSSTSVPHPPAAALVANDASGPRSDSTSMEAVHERSTGLLPTAPTPTHAPPAAPQSSAAAANTPSPALVPLTAPEPAAHTDAVPEAQGKAQAKEAQAKEAHANIAAAPADTEAGGEPMDATDIMPPPAPRTQPADAASTSAESEASTSAAVVGNQLGKPMPPTPAQLAADASKRYALRSVLVAVL